MDEELYGSDVKLQVVVSKVYYGLGADLKVGKKGDLQTVSGRENLGQALMQRLLTRKGSWPILATQGTARGCTSSSASRITRLRGTWYGCMRRSASCRSPG